MNKLKNNLSRFIIFLVLSYLVVPLIFSFVTKTSKVIYNFFSFPAYTLITIILFVVFTREKYYKKIYKADQKRMIIYSFLAICSFFVYYLIKYSDYAISNFHIILIAYTLFYILGIIFIALALFGENIFQDNYLNLTIFVLITYFFYVITEVLMWLWNFLAFLVVNIVYFILKLFYTDVGLTLIGDPVLRLKDFSVIIGAPCSGIESISMYLGLFILLIVYERKNLILKNTIIFFILGFIGVYLMNVLRLVLLTIIGTKYPQFALGSFHSQAGWILFSGLILLMIFYGYDKIIKKVNKD
jgi:exosortase/archaeosortase family protein